MILVVWRKSKFSALNDKVRGRSPFTLKECHETFLSNRTDSRGPAFCDSVALEKGGQRGREVLIGLHVRSGCNPMVFTAQGNVVMILCDQDIVDGLKC